MSLLLTPGYVDQRVDAPELFDVLATSQNGALVWKACRTSAGGS